MRSFGESAVKHFTYGLVVHTPFASFVANRSSLFGGADGWDDFDFDTDTVVPTTAATAAA